MDLNWGRWMLGLASSKLGAATTTNFGSMFQRTKFTIYYSLCCANGTPVETTPSMNFGLFAKRKKSNTSGAVGHSVPRVSLDCGRGNCHPNGGDEQMFGAE